MQNQVQKHTKKRPCALYIHIPFCVRKCYYCDFLSMASGNEVKESYIQALLRELESWKGVLGGYRLHSIFVGGGTPTCLSPKQMEELTKGLSRMLSELDLEQSMEFTVEANPGTIKKEHLSLFRAAGINRISLGLQSAVNRELEALGRIHSYAHFLESFHMLREHGFSNINIDLMYAIPGQTPGSWKDTLKKVLSLRPEHISAYSLIVEEGTPFFERAEQGTLALPSEEADRQMCRQAGKLLEEAGYRQYEISNYSLPGYACRHNLTYWNTGEYLGVGLGASSCLGGFRFQNTGDMKKYLEFYHKIMDFQVDKLFLNEKEKHTSSAGNIFQEAIPWTEQAQKEEFMFLGLRKREGVSLADFAQRFKEPLWQVYGDVLPKLLQQRLLAESPDGERIFLTSRGVDVSNRVLAEFLFPSSF